MSTTHYMVIENETNLIVASHVWSSTDTAILPDTYDNTKHTYVEHDMPCVGGTLNPDGTITSAICIPIKQVDSIPLPVDPMIAAHATIAEQANTITSMQQDILTLHSSISAIICSLNAKKA